MESPKITSQLTFVNNALQDLSLIRQQTEPVERFKIIHNLYLDVMEKVAEAESAAPLPLDVTNTFMKTRESLSKLVALEGKTDSVVENIFRWIRGEKSLKEQREEYIAEATASLAAYAEDFLSTNLAVDANTKQPQESFEEASTRLLTLKDLQSQFNNARTHITTAAKQVGWFNVWLHENGLKTNTLLEESASLTEKIQHITPKINEETKRLNKIIKESGKLKVNYGDTLSKVEKFAGTGYFATDLGTDPTEDEIEKIQKEAFHILSDKVLEEDLDYVSRTDLVGGLNAAALTTSMTVLDKLNISKTNATALSLQLEAAKDIDKKILLTDLLEKKFETDEQYLKKLQAFNLFTKLKADYPDETDEDLYLRMTLDEELLVKEYQKTDLLADKSSLAGKVSRNALISDICHSIRSEIKLLRRAGESSIFEMGSITHAIMIEVTLEKDGTYSVTVFNTGHGVPEELREKDAEGYTIRAKPFKITGLSKDTVTNFAFLEALVNCRLSITPSTAIERVYAIMRFFLIEKSGGKDVSLECPSYDIQKRGTCTYSCIEAWLQSKLTAEEMHAYRYKVVEYVADKLALVVLAQVKQYEEALKLVNKELEAIGFPDATTQSILKSSMQTLQLLSLAKIQKNELAQHRFTHTIET